MAIKKTIVPYPKDVKRRISDPMNNKIPDIIRADLIFGPNNLSNKIYTISKKRAAFEVRLLIEKTDSCMTNETNMNLKNNTIGSEAIKYKSVNDGELTQKLYNS